MVKHSIVILAAMFAVSAFAGERSVVDGKAVETHYAVVDRPDTLFAYSHNFPYGLDLERLEVRTSKVSGCKWAIDHERVFGIIIHECKVEGLADDPYYKVEKARAIDVLDACVEKHEMLSQANYQCIYEGLGIQ